MKVRIERPRGRLAASVALAGVTAGLLLSPAARPPSHGGDLKGGDIQGTRDVLQQWVETRRQLSKEKQEWTLGRELLLSRIELLEGEINSARGKIDEVQASIGESERKRTELEATRASLQATADDLAQSIAALEARTRALLARLPDPLREKLRPISQSLPADAELADRAKLGERFLTVVGVLNEVNKFNRDVRTASEIRTLSNGSTIEVTTVYIGLGQAYYASADGKEVGFGVPAEEGWKWSGANEHAAEIVRGLAILTRGADAEFVNVPIQIQ